MTLGDTFTPTFNPKHLRPLIIVRGEQWDFLVWLREPVDRGGYDGYAPDTERLRCADYIERLEAAYGTEREMHNAWRKRAEEAEAELGACGAHRYRGLDGRLLP